MSGTGFRLMATADVVFVCQASSSRVLLVDLTVCGEVCCTSLKRALQARLNLAIAMMYLSTALVSSLLQEALNGVPGSGESTHLVVPGMRTLLQRLRIHLGEVFRPIRDVYRARSSDPAARKDTDLSDPFAHHPAQDRELHLRVLGVQAHRGGGRLVRALGT